MAQPALPRPEQDSPEANIYQPRIIRGADDQAAAFERWLAQWVDVDPVEDEQAWQTLKHQLQETRRALGQRLPFPE